jgi:PKD repeat protein
MQKLKFLLPLFFIASLTIIVSSCKKDPVPVAVFTFTGDNKPSPCIVSFSNTSTDASTYLWNFGDGTTSTDQNPTHTYTISQGGSFTVVLTSTGKGGSNLATKSLTIQSQPTSLEITLKDELANIVTGASVKLYSSVTDWSNGTNQVGTTLTSDASGKVKFSALYPLKYYWLAEKDCKNNWNGGNTTASSLTANTNNTLDVILTSTGSLAFINTSSNPYRIFINGVSTYDLPGGYSILYKNKPIGAYTLRVLQLSGYALYPTDLTYNATLNCGLTLSITFP